MLIAASAGKDQIKQRLKMNAKVEKTINGVSVSANPIYKDGVLPAYWACVINEQVFPKTFSSASAVFKFVRNLRATRQ